MKFRKQYYAFVIMAVAIILFGLSFMSADTSDALDRETRKIELKLHQRQRLMERYALKALEMPLDEWVEFDSFPDDFVLYKYNCDTIVSWVNQFTIGNDEIDAFPLRYRLHYMTNNILFNAPLTYLGNGERYANLGSSWYVIKSYSEGSVKVITGILVRDEYSDAANTTYNMNPRLGFGKGYVSVGLNVDADHIVKGTDGRPLFSVVRSNQDSFISGIPELKWLAILLMSVALVFYHTVVRSRKSFAIYVIGLVVVRICARVLAYFMDPSLQFFSPMVYAENRAFNSFAALLMNNMLAFLLVQGIYIMRSQLYGWLLTTSDKRRKIACAGSLLFTAMIVAYIHTTLTSLVHNSNIVLELFRITEILPFSILSYMSYALLFVALAYCIQTTITIIFGKRRYSIMRSKKLLVYALCASLYTVCIVSRGGAEKEMENNRVLTDKLTVDRDLLLEIRLRSMESAIAADQMIATFSFLPNGGGDIIKNRVVERYLLGTINQRYNLSITTCERNHHLLLDRYAPPVNCYSFYQDEIAKYGTQLAAGSRFFHIDRYNGKTSYLGVFEYFNFQTYETSRLFIEIEKKYVQDSAVDEESGIVPKSYSYAKYVNGKIVYYSGEYDYPSEVLVDDYKLGYSKRSENGYVHFVNKASDDELVVVSRHSRGFFGYIVFVSYLFLFYSVFLMTITIRLRRRDFVRIPNHTFKRRITMLVTLMLFVALACVGIGSVVFTVQRSKSAVEDEMKSKIRMVQSRLSEYCMYINRNSDWNTTQIFDAMDRISRNMRNDINIYDVGGSLLRTTRPELFESFVMGSRMNAKAYKAICKEHVLRYIGDETVGNNKYYSVYAPLFNVDGEMVAIANIPFVARSEQIRENSVFSIATIVNIYLLLMFFSIIFGFMMANSITRPITEIKKKMESLSLSKHKQHIAYKDKRDEIGMLVSAYNKMVDDLEESTRQLSEREREQAWKEMARQIAHEIKNPLTPMRLSLQHIIRLKKNDVPGWEEKFDELSQSLLEQIDILSETASEFSSFAKFFNEQAVRLDIVAILREQMVLFNTRDDIRIEFECSLDEAYAVVRKSQIIRAFVNIISNALQAVENMPDAYVRISLSESGNDYVVAVEDNGAGVSEENLDKLFKPNFTTKSSGTGLGLAISYSIMEQSGGSIHYEKSTLGGAGFFMKIPKD